MRQRKVERVDYVRSVLEQKGTVTAQELAAELNTSRRTIYRYMDHLKSSGFGVEACPGSKGGFRLIRSAGVSGETLSSQEALSLMMAGLAILERDIIPDSQSLERALEKIKCNLTVDQWAEIRETLPNVSIVVNKLYGEESLDSWLETITECIATKSTLHVLYYSIGRDQTDRRDIDPYHLLFQGGAWYVVGYCHMREEIRTFRVDRIQELSVSGDHFERPRNFSLNTYIGASWGVMRGEPQAIKILFYPPLARFIAEGNWHASQTMTWLEEGVLLFEAVVGGLEELKRWVMGFGHEAEVLEPEELRCTVMESLALSQERYKVE